MSRGDLKPISYVVLGAVGEHGASTPDLVDMARRGAPVIWAAADSQMYSEPKRLADLGYLKTGKEPGKTRSRTVYTLTRKGRDALERWLKTPAPLPRVQHEAAIRLLAADMVPESVTREALLPLRADLDQLDALMDESEQHAHALPHRERYLLLQLSLIRRVIQAHRDWLDEVEHTLS